MADQPRSTPIIRPMMRCKTCRAWWSGSPVHNELAKRRLDPDALNECACGGELEDADMAAHVASLPYVPFDPTKEKK